MRLPLLFLSVALVTYIAVSCSPKSDSAATRPGPATAAKPDAPPKDVGPQIATPPTEFTWNPTPTLDQAPGSSPTGLLNGKPFEAKSVLFEKDTDNRLRKLTISDKAPASDTDLVTDDNTFSIEFPTEIRSGMTLSKALRDPEPEGAHAYYCYEQEDGTPMTVSPDWACAVSIDSGEDKGYDPKGEMVQITGSFSGRIALCCEWGGSDKAKPVQNYVAGTFKDAKVRYWGEPAAPETAKP